MTLLKNDAGENFGGDPCPAFALVSSFRSSNFSWAIVTSEDRSGKETVIQEGRLTVINLFVRVRFGLIEIKLVPHFAPLINGRGRVTPGYEGCHLSLGFTPGERPLEVLIKKRTSRKGVRDRRYQR